MLPRAHASVRQCVWRRASTSSTTVPRAELAERLQVVQGQVVASKMQHGVQQGAAVAVGQHKSVAVGLGWHTQLSTLRPAHDSPPLSRARTYPAGLGRVVVHHRTPQKVGHGGTAHGRARVARVGSLHLVSRQNPHGVHALLLQGAGLRLVSHGTTMFRQRVNQKQAKMRVEGPIEEAKRRR